MVSERDPWSIGLGRWGGIDIRLHISFLIAALFVALVGWREGMDAETSLAGMTLLFILVWLASILVHEAGHIAVDHPSGGAMEPIRLTPVGGIRLERLGRPFSQEMIPILAGPMVSAAATLICFAMVRSRQAVPMIQLIHPESLLALRAGTDQDTAWFLTACRMAVCINAWIVVCNLLPAFPFDAARGCQAVLHRIYPHWESRRITMWMCIVSRGLALILLTMAVILHQTPSATMVPFWLILLVLAMGCYFSARSVEERLALAEDDEDSLGYDFSQGYTSLERGPPAGPARYRTMPQWLAQLRERWQQHQARRDAEEDLRVDSILARLHSEGLQSLSPAERALLRRASVRYRNRQSR